MSTEQALASLRHLYANMTQGAVRDTASAKRIAIGLLGPAIEALERSTQATPDAAEAGKEAAAVQALNLGFVIDGTTMRWGNNGGCCTATDAEIAMWNALTKGAAVQAVGAWQDIETAPRDGTAVLGLWLPMVGDAVFPRCYAIAHFIEGDWRSVDDDEEAFTELAHWMPLPPPPSGAGEKTS